MAKARQVLEDEETSTLVQSAICFGLMNPGVSGVLVGFGQMDQIDQAIAAEAMAPLSERTMRRLDQLYESDFGLM